MRTKGALSPGLDRLFKNLQSSDASLSSRTIAVDELLALKCDKSFVKKPTQSDSQLAGFGQLRGRIDRGDGLRLPAPASQSARPSLRSLLTKRPSYEGVGEDVSSADQQMRAALSRVSNDLHLIQHQKNARA